MTSENPQNQFIADSSSEDPNLKSESIQKPLNYGRRNKIRLEEKDLKRAAVKKTKAKIWIFEQKTRFESNKRWTHFAKAIVSIIKTQEVQIQFPGVWWVNDRGIFDLSQSLERLSWLQHLRLNFYSCSYLTVIGMKHFSQILKRLTSLKSANLEFTGTKFRDESLAVLGNGFRRLICLKNLRISFASCEFITHVGVGYLCKNFKRLSFLESLALDFAHSKNIGEGCLKHIGAALTAISSSFLSLDLRFTGCAKVTYLDASFTDKGLFDLSEGLVRLKNLERIKLDLSQCKEVTDIGILSIAESLGSLVSLKDVILNFAMIPEFSDKGFIGLMLNLTKIKALESLNLSWMSCKLITDAGLLNFGEELGKFESLKRLNLDLSWSEKLEGVGLGYIAKGVGKLAALEHLEMNCEHSYEITEVGIEALFESFNKLKNLKSLSLNYNYARKTSMENKERLIEDFKAVNPLCFVRIMR